jgi:hypothetical protein
MAIPDRRPSFQIALTSRAIRLRRVWEILIGMAGVAVTVGVVTIIIHDRMQ